MKYQIHKRHGKYPFWILILLAFFGSCRKEPLKKEIAVFDHTIIQDQYGRHLILHGLNTANNAKYDPERQPWIGEANVEREDKEFGFNVVRYLIFWDAIEPEKDHFDDAYLDKVARRVEWYTSRGMYVLLDMHQDLYSTFLVPGGDGAPAWACRTNGAETLELPPDWHWSLQNINPPVINSWVNFWQYTAHKDLQEHYIKAWQKVLLRFRDNEYVIGYDLMNEPYGGDPIKTFMTGEFERVWLTGFYKRLIPAMRDVDPDKYIFFEPAAALTSVGMETTLLPLTDPGTTSRLVYAPHCYPTVDAANSGSGYSGYAKENLKRWEWSRQKELRYFNDIPLLLGEFGLDPGLPGFGQFFTDIHRMLDKNLWSWTYYSNDIGGRSPFNADGSETPVAIHLLRTYPRAVAGHIRSFSFDEVSKSFQLKYISNATIHAPTEIFLPKRFYPDGWNITITGTTDYSYAFDPDRNILKFNTTADQIEIILDIVPR